MSRHADSPYVYDRAEVRRVLETEGLAEARARFPYDVVAPIARAMGLTPKYRPSNTWQPEWNRLLGTKPDQLLAGELGQPTTTISAQRRKLGIPTCDGAARKRLKEAAILDALRALSDVDLMRRIAVVKLETRASSAQIFAERRRRGIDAKTPYGRRHLNKDLVFFLRMRQACIRAMRAECPDITLDAMGAVLGLTRQRVEQIESHEVAYLETEVPA